MLILKEDLSYLGHPERDWRERYVVRCVYLYLERDLICGVSPHPTLRCPLPLCLFAHLPSRAKKAGTPGPSLDIITQTLKHLTLACLPIHLYGLYLDVR